MNWARILAFVTPPLPRALNLSRRSSTGQAVAYAYFRPDENEAR